MNLFKIESKPLGIERMTTFLQDNYVSIGYPGIGDLENIRTEELRDRMINNYQYSEPELTQHLQSIQLFVNTMQDGDYVLVPDGDWVHLGDLGDYFYNENFDDNDNGTCHRRGVTWLKSLAIAELNAGVRELLSDNGTVVQYKGPIPSARIDLWIKGVSAKEQETNSPVQVDEETISRALHILKDALGCADPERRERAAVAILQYAK
jgi:predicted Mrr-cat superfamily restriction endonuclease